jgi:hypothetical protein
MIRSELVPFVLHLSQGAAMLAEEQGGHNGSAGPAGF